MIDFDSGAYFSTNQTGAQICDLLAQTVAVTAILANLASHYPDNTVEVETEVPPFLAQLQAEGLIIPAETDTPPAHLAATPTEPLPTFEPPRLFKYTDMQDLLLLDPIHEVDDTGWPIPKNA